LVGNQILSRVLENLTLDKGLSKDDVLTLVDAFRTVNPKDTGHVQFATMPVSTDGPSQDGQSVLYLKEPDSDALLARLGGTVVPDNVAIMTAGSSKPSGLGATGSTTSTTSPSSTSPSLTPTTLGTASTLPPSTSTPSTAAVGTTPAPSIENQSQFGTPAPKVAPCT
jgi:hypothetical protein